MEWIKDELMREYNHAIMFYKQKDYKAYLKHIRDVIELLCKFTISELLQNEIITQELFDGEKEIVFKNNLKEVKISEYRQRSPKGTEFCILLKKTYFYKNPDVYYYSNKSNSHELKRQNSQIEAIASELSMLYNNASKFGVHGTPPTPIRQEKAKECAKRFPYIFASIIELKAVTNKGASFIDSINVLKPDEQKDKENATLKDELEQKIRENDQQLKEILRVKEELILQSSKFTESEQEKENLAKKIEELKQIAQILIEEVKETYKFKINNDLYEIVYYNEFGYPKTIAKLESKVPLVKVLNSDISSKIISHQNNIIIVERLFETVVEKIAFLYNGEYANCNDVGRLVNSSCGLSVSGNMIKTLISSHNGISRLVSHFSSKSALGILIDSRRNFDIIKFENDELVVEIKEQTSSISTIYSQLHYGINGEQLKFSDSKSDTANKSKYTIGQYFKECPIDFRDDSNSCIGKGKVVITEEGYFYRLNDTKECYFICGLVKNTISGKVWVNNHHGNDYTYPLWHCYADWSGTSKICTVKYSTYYSDEKYHTKIEFVRSNETLEINYAWNG